MSSSGGGLFGASRDSQESGALLNFVATRLPLSHGLTPILQTGSLNQLASGLADAHVTANVLAETILNLAGLDRSRAETLCRAPGANLMLGPATSGFMSVVAGVGHRLNGRVDAPVTSLEAVDGTFPATRLVRSPAH